MLYTSKQPLNGQGTTGVKASYVAAEPLSTFNIKWDGTSLLNNFEYDETGVEVWRAFNVGSDKVVPWAKFEGVMKQPEKLEILDPPSQNASSTLPFKIETPTYQEKLCQSRFLN